MARGFTPRHLYRFRRPLEPSTGGYLLGVRSDVPLGVWPASVPAAPVPVAPGVRLGAGLPGVRSDVLEEPEAPAEAPLLGELFTRPLLQAAIHSFWSMVASPSGFAALKSVT